MAWLTERVTYHSSKGKFCRKGDACTVTKDGERYKIVIQHRRIGGKSRTLENTERGRVRSSQASGRRGKWLRLEGSDDAVGARQKGGVT